MNILFTLIVILIVVIGVGFAVYQYVQNSRNPAPVGTNGISLCDVQTHTCQEVATFGGSGEVKIKVSNASTPLQGIEVDLFKGTSVNDKPENVTFMRKTNEKGVALLDTVPEGSYVVFLPPVEGYDVPTQILINVNYTQTAEGSFILFKQGTERDCSSLVTGATKFGNLTVQVLGNGQPMVNLEVDLGLQPGPNNCPKETDSNGFASFQNVPIGEMAIFFNFANFPQQFSQAASSVYWVNITENQNLEKTIELSS